MALHFRLFLLALLLFPGLSRALGIYDYEHTSLAFYGSHDIRASYQQGGSVGFAVELEMLRTGYTFSDDKLYIPVNSLLPFTLYALDELGFGKDQTLLNAAKLLSLPNGIRIGFAVPPYISIMAGHHLEIYAPNLGASEVVDLSLNIFCFEASLYHRFSTVSSLDGSGASIALSWMFD